MVEPKIPARGLNDVTKLQKVIELRLEGVTPMMTKTRLKKGQRMSIVARYDCGDGTYIDLKTDEENQIQKLMKNLPDLQVHTKAMTESEFSEMCRLAVPQLMDRAIRLAMASNDPREVMAVAKEITDRGYGKVTKLHDHESEEADYLRRSWDSFPKQHGHMGIIDVDPSSDDGGSSKEGSRE